MQALHRFLLLLPPLLLLLLLLWLPLQQRRSQKHFVATSEILTSPSSIPIWVSKGWGRKRFA